MQTKSLYNEFKQSLEQLKSSIPALKIYLTDVDVVNEFPALTMRIGNDIRADYDKFVDQFELNIVVDMYLQANANNKDNIEIEMLDLRQAIESKINQTNFITSGFFKVDFISQSQPNYLERGEFYKSVTTLDFQITYYKDQ